MRCVKCPILLECSYPKKRLDKIRDQAEKIAKDIYDEELELDNSAENILRADQKRHHAYVSYMNTHCPKVLQNDRCLYERQEVLRALQKFVDAGYNISDPRCYMIISELVSNILISGRTNKAFTNLGVLLSKDTPGGPVYYQNPLLKVRAEYSKLIIETTEALDRMLKSDEEANNDKSFTAHLLKQLKIREKKKDKMLAVMDKDMIEAND